MPTTCCQCQCGRCTIEGGVWHYRAEEGLPKLPIQWLCCPHCHTVLEESSENTRLGPWAKPLVQTLDNAQRLIQSHQDCLKQLWQMVDAWEGSVHTELLAGRIVYDTTVEILVMLEANQTPVDVLRYFTPRLRKIGYQRSGIYKKPYYNQYSNQICWRYDEVGVRSLADVLPIRLLVEKGHSNCTFIAKEVEVTTTETRVSISCDGEVPRLLTRS